jgi:hypothetical protein
MNPPDIYLSNYWNEMKDQKLISLIKIKIYLLFIKFLINFQLTILESPAALTPGIGVHFWCVSQSNYLNKIKDEKLIID